MRHWWFNALPEDSLAGRRRWWTRHAHVAFGVLVLTVAGLWVSVTGDLPVLIVLNFANIVFGTRNVLTARDQLRTLTELEDKLAELEALRAAMVANDAKIASLVQQHLDAKDQSLDQD